MTIDFLGSALLFFAGTTLGSFLNVVAVRYGTDKRWWQNRSMCPHCERQLRWWELIPVFSFVLLGARCKSCRAKIGVQYFLMEVLMGFLTAVIFLPLQYQVGELWLRLSIVGVVALLLVLALIDLRTFLLPDEYVVTLGVFVALALALQPDRWNLSMVWGALAGCGFLFFLWLVTAGQGVGLGDVKLMLPIGALLGLQGVMVLYFIAFCAGGLVGIILLMRGRAAMKTAIPFGPFLVGAALSIILMPTFPSYFFRMLLG